MTQQERLRYLLEGLVAEYKEKHNEHIDIPVNLLYLEHYVIFVLQEPCPLNG